MKTAGIIAEYNPFHNGHAYHIEETRKQTGADYIIAVMSGNFVQRGAPALLNKYDRTRAALENGADLVIELPTVAALSSAEGFACGGVSLLAALGVVTDISFGCEITSPKDREHLMGIAQLFVREPSGLRSALSSYLKQGCSFPAARMKAAASWLTKHSDVSAEFMALLEKPNNILAVEYLKALYKYNYSLQPCMIPRLGNQYHDQEITTSLPSASAIRKGLFSEGTRESFLNRLRQSVPDSVFEMLLQAVDTGSLLQEDDFSSMLYYALTEHYYHLERYGSANPEFVLRLQKQLEQFESWNQFAALVKTKNRTYTAISRYFSHLLVGINQEHLTQGASFRLAPYARILGFQKSAAPLLKEIQTKSKIPVLSRLARDSADLKYCQKHLLDLDLRSSLRYNHILFLKSGVKLKSDYRQPLLYL